jgi:hypothetical protein
MSHTSLDRQTSDVAAAKMIAMAAKGQFALGPVRRIKSLETGGASSTLVSGAWCARLQGGGGSRRDGGPPALGYLPGP